HAYPASDGSGDVYFDVRSWPDYGELSNQKIDDMQAAEDAPPDGKRDSRDFALWKGRKADDPESASWPTPWGHGRPGWHLECSAMAAKYLGPEFDIHGGGLDLRFPHHENELAQSRAAGQPFARFWMHNAMLNLAGAKMSKSVGNTLMVSEVVKRVRPIALRYYLAASHYRSIVEFSEESLVEAATAFSRIEGFVRRAAELSGPGELGDVPAPFAAAMDDDLSVPAALAVLQGRVTDGNQLLAGGASADLGAALADVRTMLDVLGLDPLSPTWDRGGDDAAYAQVIDSLVEGLLEQRQEARATKDFATADRVRDQLTAAGIEIEDTPQGARWSVKGS
ncbi:MAG: cysteine--tRNA ligase, partial [Aeromicrobium sp.]|nr:cysteine--tRNA ligase [Aeromicrobium sp.]